MSDDSDSQGDKIKTTDNTNLLMYMNLIKSLKTTLEQSKKRADKAE